MLIKFIIRRIFEAIPTIFVLITFSFFLVRLAPGSPFTSEKNYPPEVMANIEAKYHLNEPMWKQYLIYLKDLAHGDFGPSFKYKDFTINQLVGSGFKVSAKLGSIVFLLVIPIGIAIGIIAALNQNTLIDYSVIGGSLLLSVIPNFVLAPILILSFAVHIRLFPSGGWEGGAIPYLVLPVLTLVIGGFTGVARLTRSSTIEVLNSNYVRTAKAKGVPKINIITRHVLKPALIPVIATLGPMFVGLITGSLVIETIFGIPGLGQLFVNGALNRDYSLVMSLTILIGVLLITFNAVVDILYALLDPRIRY